MSLQVVAETFALRKKLDTLDAGRGFAEAVDKRSVIKLVALLRHWRLINVVKLDTVCDLLLPNPQLLQSELICHRSIDSADAALEQVRQAAATASATSTPFASPQSAPRRSQQTTKNVNSLELEAQGSMLGRLLNRSKIE